MGDEVSARTRASFVHVVSLYENILQKGKVFSSVLSLTILEAPVASCAVGPANIHLEFISTSPQPRKSRTLC